MKGASRGGKGIRGRRRGGRGGDLPDQRQTASFMPV